jgi:cytochrome c oxidase assembly protein subunit 11
MKGVISREMGVRFDATIDPGMALKVEPARVETNAIGTVSTVFYQATNLSDEPLSTTASFNVTPEATGIYFNKIECFCFTEQVIPPNGTVEMPITYFVDPDLDQNSELRTIREITLSYTFHDS